MPRHGILQNGIRILGTRICNEIRAFQPYCISISPYYLLISIDNYTIGKHIASISYPENKQIKQ